MQGYIPPKGAFNPSELGVMKRALDAAWAEINEFNLINEVKDDALKRAVCLKLFSIVRTPAADPDELCQLVLSAVTAD
jgi:hypothetical protein